MKTAISVFAFTSFLFATAWTSPGYQYEESASVNNSSTVIEASAGSFSFFRTHRQGKGISASWGLTSEAGVVGFKVQKTYEDPTDPYAVWEDISFVACNGGRSYKCTDSNVFPGNSTYKIVAQNADGSLVESGISTVRIVSHK